MARSFVRIKAAAFSKMNTGGVTSLQNLGLRNDATLIIEDDPLIVDRNVPIRNFVKFGFEGETVEVDYDKLKDFLEVYCVDGLVDAVFITADQQAALDGRLLKGNEILRFGSSPNSNGYLGFGIRYTEEYSNGTKKTSCVIKADVNLEKSEADTILALALTNSSSEVIDPPDKTRINPGIITAIESPTGTPLVAKKDIHSYKLTIETKGDEPGLYGRTYPDYVSVTLEIVVKEAGVMAMRTLMNTNELPTITIKEQISSTEYTHKVFEAKSLGRVVKNEVGNKRMMTINFQGDIPVLGVTFASELVETITTNTITFGVA